ncbi:hypothetical protein E2C06_28500 [Dankookia rubra]|uniref:Uncharacterized protein n=1 Tax=Dankookia rubra TaxID=1442381 RepID=A0A4R5Q9K1_9PROT|nr:hypothetical protein [Dankookia rubra]TDH59219.1 hypothetical protein E2C06_28500 [Dankookia rubra]
MPINIVSDTVSLLWRLHLYGHAVPAGLWKATAAYAEPLFPKAGFAFANVHKAMLAAATADRPAVEACAAALTAVVEAGTLTAGSVVPAVCRAALAFAEENFDKCARLLDSPADEAVRIGGSRAQREIVEAMLLVALMRSGQAAKARDLLDRRLHRRFSPRDDAWRSKLAA